MRSVALLPSTAILAGVYAGIALARPVPLVAALLVALWCLAVAAWSLRSGRTAIAATVAAFALAGAALGGSSARDALAPPLRDALDAAYGGFAIDRPGPPAPHPPLRIRARLREDGAVRDFGVQLHAKVETIEVDGNWRRVSGSVRLTVSGDAAAAHASRWRGGRLIEAPATFRRPARYLNEGVPDFERDLALSGVALAGSIKSALLVEVAARGTFLDEAAAGVRARVRAAVGRHVSRRDAVAGAIVTAILIGDRTTLPDAVRDRLQAAGTYHVIAISGGNIAILAAMLSAALFVVGAGPRAAALVAIAGLAAYAAVVSAGPSVWRATLTAIVYLGARLLDHRSPPWNAMAVSAGVLACVAPLDARDVGFALTFGATAAILETAGRARTGRGPASWIAASALASLAVEVVLLPIGATAFSRATIAGVVLNLIAVPLMTVTQVAGLAVVLFDGVGSAASAGGLCSTVAARALVESARLVEVLPWLAIRVPPPSPLLFVTYYAALGACLWLRRARPVAAAALLACIAAVLLGAGSPGWWQQAPRTLRLTMFDVGQGDALILQVPGGEATMIDAGGAGFDGTAFDIGGRVLAPALWARGIRRLGVLAITHADPDHVGGAAAVVRDFAPAQVWQGIVVRRHPPIEALAAAAASAGTTLEYRFAGWRADVRHAHLRVLHPPPADWERPRVRNDDSLVVEVRFGDVAILLTGDISATIEQAVIPLLTPARIRILKVAHHGSRTSTSQALLDAWRPDIALISCGRGNRFGHPAPDVIRRLEAAGSQIYRTDRHGQITVDTDGESVSVRTFVSAS